MNKKALYSLSYGVFVLAGKAGDKINACITNTCMKVANSPTRVAIAVINGNYALQAGLHSSDALALESADGDAAQTYANIVACRKGDENSEKIQALISALQSDAVKQYIADTYNGAVVAIF